MSSFNGNSAIAVTSCGKVEYQFEGNSGPLVIGIHGSPGSCFQMSDFINRLRLDSSCCRWLTYSRPGYHGTPLTSGRSIAEQSALLAALLDTLKLTDPAIIIGFSAGGVMALDFTVRYPQHVSKIFLLSPITGSRSMFGNNLYEKTMDRIIYSNLTLSLAMLMIERRPRLLLRRILLNLNKLHGARLNIVLNRIEQTPSDRELLFNMLRYSTPFRMIKKGIWNDNRNILSCDLSFFKDIKQPILIAHGGRDAEVPIQQSEQLHRQHPSSSELIRVPNGGHLLLVDPHLENLRRRFAQFSGINSTTI